MAKVALDATMLLETQASQAPATRNRCGIHGFSTTLPPKCNKEHFSMAEVSFLMYGVPVLSRRARDDNGAQRAAEQVVGVLRA